MTWLFTMSRPIGCVRRQTEAIDLPMCLLFGMRQHRNRRRSLGEVERFRIPAERPIPKQFQLVFLIHDRVVAEHELKRRPARLFDAYGEAFRFASPIAIAHP
jgi:hypothetical protein